MPTEGRTIFNSYFFLLRVPNTSKCLLIWIQLNIMQNLWCCLLILALLPVAEAVRGSLCYQQPHWTSLGTSKALCLLAWRLSLAVGAWSAKSGISIPEAVVFNHWWMGASLSLGWAIWMLFHSVFQQVFQWVCVSVAHSGNSLAHPPLAFSPCPGWFYNSLSWVFWNHSKKL